MGCLELLLYALEEEKNKSTQKNKKISGLFYLW
jgi:hypothetical protein